MGKENIRKLITIATVLAVPATILLLSLLTVGQRWGQSYILASWIAMLGSLCAAIFFLTRKRNINWGIADTVITIYVLWYFSRAYFGREYPCGTVILKSATILSLYIFFRLSFNAVRMPRQFLAITLILYGCIEFVLGLYQLTTGTSRHALYPMTGNFLNPGPYSASLMLALATAIGWQKFRANKYCQIIMMVMLAVLIATFSRAAIVGIAVVCLIVFRKYYWRYRFIIWTAIIAIAVCLFFFKQGSAEGRLAIWLASMTTFAHHPWVGVGIGGFNNACGEGLAELYASHPNLTLFQSAGVTDNAYNIFVNILVEQGVVGFVLFLSLTLIVLRLYKQSKPLFYGMLSLLIFAMFSYPFDFLPYQVITATVVAWSNAESKTSNKGTFSTIRFVATITTTFIVCGLSWMIKDLITERYNADRDYEIFSGIGNEAFIKDYYQLLSLEEDNPQFLFSFAQCLRNAKRFRDSNAMLLKGTKTSADPMFYVIMGNNYADENFYYEAEAAYKHAFAMMPNHIYPLYKLMKLYHSTGKYKAEVSMAKTIVSFKEKVSSPATKEIKLEAQESLKKLEKTCR